MPGSSVPASGGAAGRRLQPEGPAAGLAHNPPTRRARITRSVAVNYLACAIGCRAIRMIPGLSANLDAVLFDRDGTVDSAPHPWPRCIDCGRSRMPAWLRSSFRRRGCLKGGRAMLRRAFPDATRRIDNTSAAALSTCMLTPRHAHAALRRRRAAGEMMRAVRAGVSSPTSSAGWLRGPGAAFLHWASAPPPGQRRPSAENPPNWRRCCTPVAAGGADPARCAHVGDDLRDIESRGAGLPGMRRRAHTDGDDPAQWGGSGTPRLQVLRWRPAPAGMSGTGRWPQAPCPLDKLALQARPSIRPR